MDGDEIKNESRTSKVSKETGLGIQEILPSNEAKCCLLANLFISEGKPGKV